MDQSIAAKLSRAEEMLAGLEAHAEELAARGLDTDFVTKMTASHTKAQDAYIAKLAFKARTMEKRAEQDQYLAELHDQYAEARKLVKLELPVETWREFGITDQR